MLSIAPPWPRSAPTLADSWLGQLAQSLDPEHTDAEAAGQWQPLPGPQTQAIESAADEVFYGGAAGSGKTDLALGLAFTRHRASVIFRREYAQLSEVIRRSREIAPPGWTYSESRSTWRGPDGRFLEFAGCEHEDDKRKWRGRPHDLYVFDEAPEFTETQVRFITAWLRS